MQKDLEKNKERKAAELLTFSQVSLNSKKMKDCLITFEKKFKAK